MRASEGSFPLRIQKMAGIFTPAQKRRHSSLALRFNSVLPQREPYYGYRIPLAITFQVVPIILSGHGWLLLEARAPVPFDKQPGVFP